MPSSLRRLRPLVAIFALVGVGLGAARCSLPALPPGPQAPPTRVGLVRGAVLRVPESSEAGLPTGAIVAQMRELRFNAVIVESSADQSGEHIAERVALAIDLQRDLDADVLIGTYRPSELANGLSMPELLESSPTPNAITTECWPGGPKVDPAAALVTRLRTCSEAVATQIADALAAAGASPRIGCFVPYPPELADALPDGGAAALRDLYVNGAGPCAAAGRPVAVTSILTPTLPSDPDRAGVVVRESVADSGVALMVLQDGVAFTGGGTHRGSPYYQGLRNSLIDRVPVAVWAGVEAFDCPAAGCASGPPTDAGRFTRQLCGARNRVDGIVMNEYIADFGFDAGAGLRQAYLEWVDAGASCSGP